MPTVSTFGELEAWQTARALARRVYAETGKGRLASDFASRDQLRRASISEMSNIAEGFERDGTAEFLQFLAIAKGSAGEVRAQLYIALDQGYLDAAAFQELVALAAQVGRLIGGLMSYLRKSGFRGPKYREG